MKKLIFILLLRIFFNAGNIFAQEIKADITVNMDQLPFELRTNVSTMESDLERYINNNSFMHQEWEGEQIPVDINIFLSGGNRNIYEAKIFISSYRFLDGPNEEPGRTVTIKLFDTEWTFEYSLGANLSYNELRFDPFTSLIDFYMLLVIGFDLDTYGKLGGTKAFEKAKTIFQLGASAKARGYSTYTKQGEFNRFNLVNELNDLLYENLRTIIYKYYILGLDLMAFEKEKALKNIVDILSEMVEFKKNKMTGPSVLMQAFFDTKAQELGIIFNGYSNQDVFTYLMYLDPGNTIIYNDARDGKLK
mgnify:CR=1 FL=1